MLISESKLVKLKNGDTIEIPDGEKLVKETDDYIVIDDINAKCRHDIDFDSWDYQFVYKVESRQYNENFEDDLYYGYNDSDEYTTVADYDGYASYDMPDKAELTNWLMQEYPKLFTNEDEADEGVDLLIEILLNDPDTNDEVAYEIVGDFEGNSTEYIKEYIYGNGIMDTIWIDDIEDYLPNYNYCWKNHIYY